MNEVADGAKENRISTIERPQPIVRADKMLHVVYERKNVAEMSRFLRDFGLIPADGGNSGTLYFRGHGPSAYLVAIIPADQDRFVGFGVSIADAEELKRLSQVTGTPIHAADGPGGGQRVRLIDPDGLRVDVIHGAAPVKPLPARDTLVPVNTPYHHARINAGVRTPVEPSPIFRLGHIVLLRPDFGRATDWYMRHIGLIPSDIQSLPDGGPGLGFFRLNRGDQPADHHSVAFLVGPKPGIVHVAFETLDIETVGQGHEHLRAAGWTPFWGIGRHKLGSQVFDYWKDPVGDEWEHYADGDVFDAHHPTGYSELTLGSLWTWGDHVPGSMKPDIAPEQVETIHAAGGFGDLELGRARALIAALQVRPRPWTS